MHAFFTRALWLVLLPLLALLAAPARAENVFIMDLNLNGIYSVDVVSGGPATLLTPINPPANPQGYTLATRPSDGMLFYLDSSGTNPNLWRWNPATPNVAPVLVGTPGATTTNVVRLGFDNANNLLAMDTTTSIWTLDTNTGGILSTTPLSGDLPTSSGDLCLNTNTGVLYMVANQDVFTVTSAGVSTRLGTITGTGITGVAAPNGYVTGCAFTHDGTMLISMYNGGNLRKVNLATLAATALPNTTGMANIGDLSTAPQRVADLSLTKTASNATPGATTSFTVTVTNNGPVPVTDARVLDAVPAGLTVTSFTPSQGTYSTSTVGIYPAGTWRIGVLAVGASATLTMNVDVSGSTAVTNTAQISYSDQYDPDSTPNNSLASEDDQASVLVTPSPDLTLSKVPNSSFTVGLTGTYSITVSNAGSAATSGTYTVVDVLPATLTYVSATGTGWSCSNASGTVTCTSSTVIGARATNPNPITLTVTPSAGAAPTVTNTAAISGGGEPASNNGNNTSTVGNVVCSTSCPDLRPNKTLATSSMTVGTTVTYTLSVTNVGGTTTGAATYTLSDPLPTGLTLYSAPVAGAGWSCPAAAPNNVVGGTGVLCTRSTALLAGNTSTTVTFVVNVLNTAVPQVVNTASVSGGGEPPTANGNNNASLTTVVNDFDLSITKVAGSLAVGSTSTYTFTVANTGSRATTGTYSFTDDLPAGLTIRSLTPTNWTIGTGWTCAANGDQPGANTAGNSHIYCTRSTSIPIGGTSTTVVVPVTVGAAAAPSVTNTVNVVGAAEAPANTGNNSYALTTPVTAPDLAVTKSHNGSFAVGVTATYTVTVTNIGQMTTTGTVTMVDTLPAGLTYVSAVGTNWTCSFASPNVTCTRTTVIADNTSAPPVVISVVPTAAAAAASPVVNSVTVSGGSEPAGNSGNNTATDSTIVSYPPVLAKSFSPASVPAGGTSTLTLTVTNPAGGSLGSITGVAITDPFPAGMAIASPPSVVNTCGFTVNSGGAQGDTIVDVAGGATGGPGSSCLISFRVVATGTLGTLTNTTGAVRSANAGTGNLATATLVVTAPGSPVLTKVTSPNPVGVGENSILTFTISNKASATTDMGFRDTLPTGLVVAPSGAFGGTCTSTGGTALGRVGAPGTSTLTITGVDLGASASCTITIPVRSTVAGTYTNTTSNISNLLGGLTATTVNDTLVVEAVGLSKTFTPSSIVAGGTSTMALVLTNGPGLAEQNGIAFTETLPAGVTLSSVPAASQCGGTVTGTAGGGTLAVSGATLAAGLQSCTVTAVVTAAASGSYNNAAANISGLSINLVNNVTATLTVTPPPGPNLTKTNGVASISPGDTTTYVITMSNTSGATYTGGTAAVLKDPAVANLTINSAACAAQGGATCPALASAAMITALQSAGGMTVSSMPNNSTVVLTLTATLSGNPTGTLTNVATATSGAGVTTVQDSDTIVYPNLSSTKTVAVVRDPINGTSNPKNIPGSESLYTITVTNSGLGRVDDGTIGIVDPIPPNTALFVNSLGGSPAGPVTFADAGSSLTLAYTALNSAADDIDFSNDGGTTWAYTPVPDGTGYDAAVTHLRVRPRGRMAGWSGAGPYPSFTIAFKVKLN
ncbi:DUF11 domain-containing protein [Ramlibacter sp. XY19]|uniref:beta strand repeat-containing protein n=1 Tax=Ramlibacter paludis TaxID=2908000 RepID=UPI0023DCEA02|nr:DUF11 domain-containing protein [Ramlibacter paludis]MCG2595272.1 DUF11 domain-containing protein [Ramlibacter paludis]